MLKRRDVEVRVVTSQAADRSFISDIENLGIATFGVPHRLRGSAAKYPDLNVERYAELIKSSDVVWITDLEYLCAPRIKRIDRSKPVVAHITSNRLACPGPNAAYGMSETCTENCSHSLRRFARCRKLSKQYLRRWHWSPERMRHWSSQKMRLYEVLNFPKSCVDFIDFPIQRSDKVFESIDGFVALSEFTRDLMRIHLPQLNDAPIEVVPNPVTMPEPIDPIPDQGSSRRRSVLYTAGPWVNKGPHIVLYAIRKLVDEGSKELTLTMLGVQGNGWIKSLVERLQIEKHVRLLSGWLPKPQVGALMSNSAVVLLPYLTPEPFPRVSIEANLMGSPVVVSNRGALPDLIVDNVTGFVAEPSVEAFAKSTDNALKRNWNRELIAQTAKAHFDPERITDKLLRALEAFA